MRRSLCPEEQIPLGLHVLGLPLAFILSQDQTLHCMFVCPYTQTQFKIDALVFFPYLVVICYVNELRSFRFLRTLNLSSCSWFASAKVNNFFQSAKTFLKFFFVTSKSILANSLSILLRSSISRFGTAKIEKILLSANFLKSFFWKYFLLKKTYSLLLFCAAHQFSDLRVQRNAYLLNIPTLSLKIKLIFDNTPGNQKD